MSEKRFVYGVIKGSRQAHIKDCHTCKSATIDVYDDDFKYFVDKLNEQQATIENYRKSRDKWKQKALAKDEQLKDCDNDCFNCKFYNKVCDFCTKFNIGVSTNE